LEGKEIEIEMKNPYLFLLLGFLIVVLYFELNVTINNPIAFGDEGFHTYVAKLIASQVEYPKWESFYSTPIYLQGFERPPMFNLFEASFYFIFGFSETIVKVLLPVLSFFIGLGAFLIFKRLYSDQVGVIAAIILVAIPAITTYSVLFYVDTFLVFWFLFAIGFFLLAIKEEKRKYLIFSGVFSAFAILTKNTGYVLFIFYGLYFLYELFKERKLVSLIKKYLPLAVMLALVLGPFYLRNYVFYKTPLCGLPYVFTSEKCNIQIQYTNKEDFVQGSGTNGSGEDVYQFGIMNYFQFAYGSVWLVPLFFVVGIIFVLFRRDKLDFAIIIFLLASSFIFYLTYKGRAEDASRYTLFAIPVIALITGIYFEAIISILKKYFKYFGILFLVLILIASYYNFSTKISAMPQVKQFSPLFFDACNWVKANLPQNARLLSLYGHPTIYNCQRNATWELIDLPDMILSNDRNLTVQRLDANGINYIFIQKFAISQTAYRQSYPVSFIAFLEQNPQTFKKVFENGPDYNSCLQSGGCDGTAIYQVIS